MSDPPFDFGLKSFADFWSQAGKAAQQAQEDATRSFTEALKSTIRPAAQADLPVWPGAAVDNAELARASEALAELWKAATELSTGMAKSLAGAGNGLSGAKLDPTVEATFRAMADPRTWLAGAGGMDLVIGAVAQGPQLADLWNAERQQARVMQAWTEMRRRTLEHNAVVMQGWLGAARAFGEEIAGRTKKDGNSPDHKTTLALWAETANRVMLETQRSEPFLQTQAAMIRSGAEFRMAQREMAERWAAQFGFPTRTELDDVHRSLTELRREFRAFRRKHAERGAAPARKSEA